MISSPQVSQIFHLWVGKAAVAVCVHHCFIACLVRIASNPTNICTMSSLNTSLKVLLKRFYHSAGIKRMAYESYYKR
jgi:hypothetical protein